MKDELANLRERRKSLEQEAAAIVAKATAEKRALTAEEQKDVDGKLGEIDGIKATIQRAERLAELQAEAVVPEVVREPAKPEPAPMRVEVVDPKGTREKGELLGTWIRARRFFGADQQRALQWARVGVQGTPGGGWGESSPEYRALMAGDFVAGGALVPESMRNEVIELLRARAVIRSLNPRMIPLVNGSAMVPKVTAGVTGTWLPESTNISKSEPTFGQVKLSEKTLAVLVPVSNTLFRVASPDVDRLIRDDITESLANTEDTAFIRADGTASQPKGLRFLAPAASVANSAGTTLANVRTDFRNLFNRLTSANNVKMRRPAILMSQRSASYMQWDLVDANSNFAFPEFIQTGRIRGTPVGITNNIPDNLGGGANESEVYLVDMDEVLLGESFDLQIEVSNTAAYHDGSAVVSAWSRDETSIRAIHRVDLAMRHVEAVALRTAVTWGA